jgi:hypothetical protein
VSSEEERVIELLEELVAWTRFGARAALLEIWETVLKDDKHLLAYELSDGTRSQKEVGDAAGLSQPSVSGLWQRWRRLGVVRPSGNRVAHLASPSDMGMERAQKLVGRGKPKASAADGDTDDGGT